MKLMRLLTRIMALTAALFSGALFTACPMYGIYPMYGPVPAYGMSPPVHDSTVQITDFSYTPASPVHAGEQITFTLTLNKPTSAGGVYVALGPEPGTVKQGLTDDGYAPDALAGDGVYTGIGVWQPSLPLVENTPVTAHLIWYDGAAGQTREGLPLTVLAAEE
jgi:hypothetical protein